MPLSPTTLMCSVDDVSGVVEEREILLVLVYGQGIITLAGINGDLVVAGSYSRSKYRHYSRHTFL